MRLRGIVHDCPEPRELAAFYERLLGWTRVWDSVEWVKLMPPVGDAGLSFQQEPLYVAPVWPSTADHQQLQVHLDFEVDDLPAAVAHAQSCGAVLSAHQPVDDVRVMLDPVGHPFCLFLPGA